MSPIIGLFIALFAAWIAPSPRVAASIVLPPLLGATAAQAWYLGSGRGHNPASTTADSPLYWVVQALIVVAICGVGAGLCWVRQRVRPAERSLPDNPLRWVLLAVATVAAFAVTLGVFFLTDRPAHPGRGNGNIPIAGAVAVVVGLGVLIWLALGWIRRSRQRVVT